MTNIASRFLMLNAKGAIRNGLAGAGANAAVQAVTSGTVDPAQVAVQGAIASIAGIVGNAVGLSQSLTALTSGGAAQEAIAIGSGAGTTAAIGTGAAINSQVSPSYGGHGN
ncbi:MAG TPA: hypothetical protein VIF10_05780 [Methylobacter sp.]|jgi:hypothetical protein